jgi:hypothetical protein
MYKLGSVARAGAPVITLQAAWTADDGNLPPWERDFHNDLNTQLSYWPAYTGNHLNEAATYTDWLWTIKQKNKQYTNAYFGVATLHCDATGGWMQYSLSPTIGAWCAGIIIAKQEWLYTSVPATPESWQNISFKTLRAEGGFLISAKKENGVATKIIMQSKKDSACEIKIPFSHFKLSNNKKYKVKDRVIEFSIEKNETVTISKASN